MGQQVSLLFQGLPVSEPPGTTFKTPVTQSVNYNVYCENLTYLDQSIQPL